MQVTIYGQSLLENESDEVSAFSKWFSVKLRGQVRHADSAMMISSMIRKREKKDTDHRLLPKMEHNY